jgi:hypothetical protein
MPVHQTSQSPLVSILELQEEGGIVGSGHGHASHDRNDDAGQRFLVFFPKNPSTRVDSTLRGRDLGNFFQLQANHGGVLKRVFPRQFHCPGSGATRHRQGILSPP